MDTASDHSWSWIGHVAVFVPRCAPPESKAGGLSSTKTPHSGTWLKSETLSSLAIVESAGAPATLQVSLRGKLMVKTQLSKGGFRHAVVDPANTPTGHGVLLVAVQRDSSKPEVRQG